MFCSYILQFFIAIIAATAMAATAASTGKLANAHAPTDNNEPTNYQYQYAVNDEYANLRLDAFEVKDGYGTNGGYSVHLPDGRTQIVKYTVADEYSGYVADVQYEGYAKEFIPAEE
jgi:hypothetical protein